MVPAGSVLRADGRRKPKQGALANAKRIIETVSGADASLIEIDKLAKHRVISETEKDEYWNPRWWAKSDKDAKGAAEGAKGEGADEALTLILLSEKDPSQCQEAPQGWRSELREHVYTTMGGMRFSVLEGSLADMSHFYPFLFFSLIWESCNLLKILNHPQGLRRASG